ncbi:MAG TPA: GNAT family N-acetyltransferase [Caulobacteraceae bacterium]|nr:GNAT family N-acetyltransferase [Caulobacteraceae bacterium]
MKADEVVAVAQLHVQADRETYQPIFGAHFEAADLDLSQLRWDVALAAGDVLLVALEDGRMVGLAHATPTWMSALYLLSTHIRRGIGLRLLVALCEALQARGVAEIGFKAVAGNTNAIAFYQAVGAQIVGRETQGEGDAAWEDIVFSLATDAPAAFRRG